MAVQNGRHKRAVPPLDGEGLERLAVSYAGRYAVTRAKLKAYLVRKLRERGWGGDGEPPVDSLVERCARLGYVDDVAFAAARAESLSRRGYGARRVETALKVAGIDEADGSAALEHAAAEAWHSALRFAERRRIGPFAEVYEERPQREKKLAAMLRAGHPLGLARKIVAARPGEFPEADD
ncbi:MAG: RecX family transcriptional regulator [Alphaproteobacteria bacterium]|jgi:regulatory protein|nr:RecX family transcriptional regulator [Alphaproteobacteria bacterium]